MSTAHSFSPVVDHWEATHWHFIVTLFTMMYPVVYRRGSNATINSSGWAYRLLWSGGFNTNQWEAADDLIHMRGNSGECFVFLNIYGVWLLSSVNQWNNLHFIVSFNCTIYIILYCDALNRDVSPHAFVWRRRCAIAVKVFKDQTTFGKQWELLFNMELKGKAITYPVSYLIIF